MSQVQTMRGLSTLAMLKARYDRGQDHIEMFQPFLDDVIRSAPSDELLIEDVRSSIEAEHGLRIPLSTLGTLLSRATRRGVVRREGGRFFRVAVPPVSESIAKTRAAIEREHSALAKAFIEYADESGRHDIDDEHALHLILTFLSVNHMELLLDDSPPSTSTETPGLARKDSRLVARFVEARCFRDPQLYEYLTRILEGLILQNTLLLRDIAAAKRQFRDLQAFFDSGFLFALLGLKGTSAQLAAVESLAILGATNVRARVFDKTIDEMKRILAMYENKLATAQGRHTLWPTDLTRFFLTKRYQPSDIREIISLLPQQLAQLGVSVVALPHRDRRYTLDENALAAKIKYPSATEINPRVLHDVDCIAGVLVIRGDSAPQSWEDAKAAFVTVSALLVRNARQWFEEAGGVGLPPLIHSLALTNLAWLKKPAAAQSLKQRELVALCEAALRPTKELWQKFLAHLRNLEASGRVTSDEAVAILASDLTDRLLSQIEDDEHVEAQSVAEIVERVKAEYKKEAEERVAQAKAETTLVTERHRRLVIRLIGRADNFTSAVTWALTLVIGLLIAYGLLLSVPNLVAIRFPGPPAQLIARLSIIAFLVATYAGIVAGHHLSRWHTLIRQNLQPRVRRFLLGDAES